MACVRPARSTARIEASAVMPGSTRKIWLCCVTSTGLSRNPNGERTWTTPELLEMRRSPSPLLIRMSRELAPAGSISQGGAAVSSSKPRKLPSKSKVAGTRRCADCRTVTVTARNLSSSVLGFSPAAHRVRVAGIVGIDGRQHRRRLAQKGLDLVHPLLRELVIVGVAAGEAGFAGEVDRHRGVAELRDDVLLQPGDVLRALVRRRRCRN